MQCVDHGLQVDWTFPSRAPTLVEVRPDVKVWSDGPSFLAICPEGDTVRILRTLKIRITFFRHCYTVDPAEALVFHK